MMKAVLSLLVLGLTTLAFGQTIVFKNLSDHPVMVATAYNKDLSIAGIGGSGSDDPNPFTHVKGYFEVAAHNQLSIDEQADVHFAGQMFRARLAYLRVIVKNGSGDQAIVHPTDTGSVQPSYLPVHKNNNQVNWFFTVRGTIPPFTESINRWQAQGQPVVEGMFYGVYQYRRTSVTGENYIGVGAPGTSTAKIINDFFQTHAEFDGFTIRMVNRSGVSREFQLSYFDLLKNQWATLGQTQQAIDGGVVEWSLDANTSVGTNADGTQQIKIEGKDFYGNLTTWGPINADRSMKLYGGKLHTYIVGNLNP